MLPDQLPDRILEENKFDINRIEEKVLNVLNSILISGSWGKEDRPRFVVDFTDEQIRKLQEGSVNLLTGKDGKIYAQMFKNGKFSDKLPIHEEFASAGLNPGEALMVIQMANLQSSLVAISEALEDINRDLNNIKRDMDSDRRGRLEAAVDLYREGSSARSFELRQSLIVEAIGELSVAGRQMSNKYSNTASELLCSKKLGEKKRKELLQALEESYRCFHMAQLLKARIYYEMGEIDSIFTVLGEYRRFSLERVQPNILEISEYDDYKGLFDGSKWSRYVESLDLVNEIEGVLEMLPSLGLKNKKEIEENEKR